MAYVLSSVSGNLISAASAGYAPTNSGDVSAIASAYQVVSSTATQLYAGTAYMTSINEAPVSAARAGNAANAALASSAYYDGTGRLISALPDSATVSAIASSYAESAASSKLDSSASSSFYPADNPSGFISSVDLSDYVTTAYVDSSISGFAYESAVSAWTAKQDQLTFGYNTANQISSIDGSALGGMDDAAVSAIASAYAESAASSKQDTLTFGYNAEDKISGINGSALAGGGGGGLVTAIGTSESGITSINNSGLVDTAALRSADYSSLYVQEPLYISASGDSSYIGFSGTQVNADWTETASSAPSYIENKPDLVDIVAGPGIVIDNPDGNTLRVSVAQDVETVLFEDLTADGTVVASVVLSETSTNFEEIEITVGWKGGSTSISAPGKIIFKCKPDGVYYGFGGLVGCDNSSHFVLGGIGTSGTTLALKNVIDLYSANLSSITPQSFNNILRVYKVVGIHRIQGGN